MTSALLTVFLYSQFGVPGNFQGDFAPQDPPAEPYVFSNEQILPVGVQQVTIGDSTYFVTASGDIGPRVPTTGLWSGIQTSGPGAEKQKVRVVFVNDSALVVNRDGTWVSERSFLWSDRIQEAKNGLEMVRAFASQSGGAGVDLSFTYSQETDPYYFEGMDSAGIDQWLIEHLYQPRSNASQFDSQDPTDFGPYDMTVILHAAWSRSVTIQNSAKGTVIVAPIYAAPKDIASFVGNLVLGAWLQSEKGPRSITGVSNGSGMVQLKGGTDAQKIVASSPGGNQFALDAGTKAWVGKVKGSTVIDWLKLEPKSIDKKWDSVGTGFGDFESTVKDSVIAIVRKMRAPTGGVVLAESAPGLSGKVLIQGKVRSNANDSYALRLIGASGERLFNVQISGHLQKLPFSDVVHAQVEFDGEWHDFQAVVDSSAAIRQVQFGTLHDSLTDRNMPEGEFFEFQAVTISRATEQGTIVSALPRQADSVRSEFLEVPVELPSNRWGSLRDALTGKDRDAVIAAINVLTKTRHLEAVPILQAHASSALEDIVPIAVKALAFQGTEEANLALRMILEKGPFSVNRKAAWAVLKDWPKDESWSKTATILSIEVPWQIRAIGLELSSQIPSEQTGVIVLTSFQDVDPYIRTLAASKLNPNNELIARRLIFMGVNDASESVRVACLTRLFDSDIERFRKEAHRGVRDESLAVRLEILDFVAKRGLSKDRPVLQLAMLDSNPQVLSMALASYATQPENVELREIQSVLKSESVIVIRSLLRLAIAKKLVLPADVLGRFIEIGDPAIDELLSRLGGQF